MRLTAVILTFNESLHIERCIQSAKRVADDVIVVDSYSTDDTVRRARALGARVVQHEFTNQALQLNWALDNLDIGGDWILRLDADEFLDETLSGCVRRALSNAPADVSGFQLNRRIVFMGREIRHGGMAPLWILRLFRNGHAHCEARWMDEHMVLTAGTVARLPGHLVDENLNTITWWTQKHNHYASREAADLLDSYYQLGTVGRSAQSLSGQARWKRWLKTAVYSRLPIGIRPWLYFFYRMILRMGLLDRNSGMIFHTLQGLWYRLLVDAKVQEVHWLVRHERCDPEDAIRRALGINLRCGSTHARR